MVHISPLAQTWYIDQPWTSDDWPRNGWAFQTTRSINKIEPRLYAEANPPKGGITPAPERSGGRDLPLRRPGPARPGPARPPPARAGSCRLAPRPRCRRRDAPGRVAEGQGCGDGVPARENLDNNEFLVI